MSYINLRSWIKTKLETISDLEVFDYPTNDHNYYPYVVIESSPSTAEYGTNRQVKRVYNFSIHLYMSLADNVRGAQNGETLFLTKVDEITSLFDNPVNWHSEGNSDLVRLTNTNLENIEDAGPYVRHAELNISITKLSA